MPTKPTRDIICPLAIALLLGTPSVSAQDSSSDSWDWSAEVYFWGASLGGETTSGDDIDLGIDKILEDLEAGAMGTVAASKGQWTIFSDMIYLDVKDSGSATTGVGPASSVTIDASIELKGFITTLGAGYRAYEQSGNSLDVIGGLRYLWLESEIDIDVGPPVGPLDVNEKDDGTNTDVVVGLRGKADINDKWYLSYYADVGTGDSDLTVQALAAVNYRLETVHLTAGYRYLEWDFDDFGPFDDLDLSGAFAGAKFYF